MVWHQDPEEVPADDGGDSRSKPGEGEVDDRVRGQREDETQVLEGRYPDGDGDEGLDHPVDEGLGMVYVRQVRADDVEDVAEGHRHEGQIDGEAEV